MNESSTAGTLQETVFDVTAEKLADVYAAAALDAAGDQQAQQALVEELRSLVSDVLNVHPDFEKVLGSALVGEDEKLAILDRVFAGKASTTLLSFLKVMAAHDRLGVLRQVVRSADKLWETRSNRLPVKIELASETQPELVDEMVAKLRQSLGSDPVVTTSVNPDLIGGFVVRVGDRVYDGSVRTSLERARAAMVTRAVEAIQGHPDQFMQQD